MIAIVLLAGAARAAYLAETASGPLGNRDSAAYEDLAAKLRAGKPYQSVFYSGFGDFPAGLTRPPGYPAFLSVVASEPREHQVRTAIVQIVLSCAIVLALVLLTTRLLSPAAGLAAGMIYAVDWTTIIHTPLSLADSIYAWPVGLAVLILAFALKREPASRSWWLVAVAGLLLGVACLVKPGAEVLLVGLAVFVIVTLRPWRYVLVFLVAVAIPIVPWVVRNDSVYGELTISSISTANLYFETALGTYAYRSPISTDFAALSSLHDRLDAQWATRKLTPSDRSSEYRRLALKRLEAKWPIALDQAAVGLVRTAFGTGRDTVAAEWPGSPPSRMMTTYLPLLEVVLFWILVGFGAYTAWRDKWIPRRIVVLFLLAVVLALLPAAEPGGYARFRVPAVPMMAVLGGAAAEGVRRKLRIRSASTTATRDPRIGLPNSERKEEATRAR